MYDTSGRIKLVYRFGGGVYKNKIVVLDYNDDEIKELQGDDSPQVRKKINERVDKDTKYYNYKV